MKNEISIHICKSSKDFEVAKELTLAYFDWLGMDLNFQDTRKEFEVFHEMYGEPSGTFIFAKVNGELAGGVGTRYLEDGICEMKRLYVYDSFQGYGLGRMLCEKIMVLSKSLGYTKMRLDTVERLEAANALYEKLGYYDIPEYYPNPDPTVRYMEIELVQ
jgi:ribosomal protein S18 acetylase RimI-like enzyme